MHIVLYYVLPQCVCTLYSTMSYLSVCAHCTLLCLISVCVHIVLYYQNSVVKPCVELICLLNQVVPKTYSCVAKLIRLGLFFEHYHKPSSPKGQHYFSLIASNTLVSLSPCTHTHTHTHRYNVSQLEDWAREQGAMATAALPELLPIVEAAKLLQIRKSSNSHAKDICDHCSHLNALQVGVALIM